MFRRTLISAFVLIAFAAPAASQTVPVQAPPVPPANESVSQRQARYDVWRAANTDIDTRVAAYVEASRAQAASHNLPPEQMRERLRAERFAELAAASAATPQAQRDQAREVTATATGLLQAEQFDAAALLFVRALELDPGNAAAAYQLSVIFARQRRAADAHVMLQRTLAFSAPNSAEEALAAVALRNRPMTIFDVPDRPVMVWDCAMCPEMAVIPGGAFGGLFLDAPYAVGRFEVTFDEWGACVQGGGCQSNPRPSGNANGRGRRPVVGVSWSDAQDYVTWLSSVTGKRYFLPNDGQWEFAARGGAVTRYHWGDNPDLTLANLARRTSPSMIDGAVGPVGQFPPNAFGVFDAIGNVSEWADGCMTPGATGAACLLHSTRGGNFNTLPELMNLGGISIEVDAAHREVPTASIGFRVARALVEAPPAPDPAP